MKNILITLIVWSISNNFVVGQDAITSLSTTIFDQSLQLNTKDKKTFSQHVALNVPEEFFGQFERIDAVYISFWIGAGSEGLVQYRKDSIRIAKKTEMSPILYYAEKSPKAFTRPTNQTGFGLETILMKADATEKCLTKYLKKKIAPRGFYPCVIKREWTTTSTNFLYRFAVPKEFYANKKCPNFKLYLRTSAKADTVLAHCKIAVTIKGKRRKQSQVNIELPSVNDFMEIAILNGLKKDGFPKDQAQWVLQNNTKLFVGKCPICTPTEGAFRKYIANYEEKASQTPDDIIIGLSKDNTVDMQKAFSQLIARYVGMHYEQLNFSASDKAKMEKELEAARKTGMGRKAESFGKFCPSCDGACKIKHE